MRTFPDAFQFCLSAAFSALAGKRYLSCLWELTYRCTAQCQICGYWKLQSRPEDELTLAQIKTGLRRIFEYGCRLVNFTGGEPTLRQDLEEIVAYASGLGMWTSVVTNGSLLTRERIRNLRDKGLDNLLISLDSVSPEIHDAQRGILGSHAKAEQCLEWMARDFLMGHRTGGVMCVISSRNSGEISELVRFARDHGVFILFQPYHINKTGNNEFVPEIRDLPLKQLEKSNHRPKILLNSRSYLLGLDAFLHGTGSRTCHAGRKYFSVDPFGFLHPCVDMPPVGRLLQDDITVVKSGKAMQTVKQCPGCWYCFRGEADTSLSLAGCWEKARLGMSVFQHNILTKG
jgi:MoaA/NifB/PqqE/SkfB family radical SAM enzyme